MRPVVIETTKDSNEVVILPMGGLGRIGMNMTLLGVRGDWHVIDCGVRFPDPEQFGASAVLPDMGWLRRIGPQVRSIVLTHGHEDHVGALPYLLEHVDAPVHGTRFTLELVRRKLADHRGMGEVVLETIEPGSECSFPGVRFRFLRVTHSLPDCVAVVAETDQGRVVHTGDWKIDREPIDGEHFDESGFRALGDEGVRLLLSDSTNALVPGWTASEASLEGALREQITTAPGRVLVTTFASNLYRLETLCRIAADAGRSVVLMGRSLTRYVEVARAAGRWSPDPGLLVAPNRMNDVPHSHLVVVLTGTQGEPGSALARCANGDHPQLSIEAGDRVLHSARIIPGNERSVNAVFRGLLRRGAEVVSGLRSGIHCSGHARQDELDHMLGLVRPESFLPIHGEIGFLLAHAERARDAGVSDVRVVEDGCGLVLSDGGLRETSIGPLESWFHDGSQLGTFEELGFRDRIRLAYNGVVGVHVKEMAPEEEGGFEVDLDTRGLYTDEGRVVEKCRRAVQRALDDGSLQEEAGSLKGPIERLVRGIFKREVGARPEVMVFITPAMPTGSGGDGKG
jgi:ribonuclease J